MTIHGSRDVLSLNRFEYIGIGRRTSLQYGKTTAMEQEDVCVTE